MSPPFSLPPHFYADPTCQLVDPGLRAFKTFWEGRREDGRLPHADCFDPMELRPFLGYIFIVSISPDLATLVYTLVGTRMVEIIGRDATGRRVEDTVTEGHPLPEFYRHVARHGLPARVHGVLTWVDKDYRQFECALLPVVNDSGRVCKILGMAAYNTEDGRPSPR